MKYVEANKSWDCPACNELVPSNFHCCWSCGSDRQGNRDPHFVSQNDEPIPSPPERSRLASFVGLVIWTTTCCILLLLAVLLDRWLPIRWNLRLAGILILFIFGVLAGVIVNILAQAYPVLIDYLYSRDRSLVQLQDSTKRNQSDHES